MNPGMILSDTDICNIVRRRRAATTIQKTWRQANTNPKNKICQRRLLYEYNKLIE